MHMYMVGQLLVPGVEHLYDPRYCTEPLFIGGQFQKCFSAAPVKKTIQELLVAVNERIELMGQGKDHMEVRRVNDFCPAFVHPDLFENSLTVRTVTVTAGVVMEFHMAAVRTPAHIDSKFSGFTVQNGTDSFPADVRLERILTAVLRIGVFKYFPDSVFTHDIHLPGNRKD